MLTEDHDSGDVQRQPSRAMRALVAALAKRCPTRIGYFSWPAIYRVRKLVPRPAGTDFRGFDEFRA